MPMSCFVGEEFVPLVDDEIRGRLRSIRQVTVLSSNVSDADCYVTWRNCQSDADPRLPTVPGYVVLQLCTSGTTGHPKGAQLTNANFIAALIASAQFYPCTTEDVNLACLLQFHIAGTLASLWGISAGARTSITREANSAEILQLIPGERVPLMLVVPALLLFILTITRLSADRFLQFASGSLRRVTNRRGGAPFGDFDLAVRVRSSIRPH
jgi:acyl-CoA synthetase (AMP-forming)/AMP-acid ligase II